MGSLLSAVWRRPIRIVMVLVVCLAVQLGERGNYALAGALDKPLMGHTPPAPAGPGPVDRPLPDSASANHGLQAGQRPPVVPPAAVAAAPPRKLTAAQWANVPKPAGRGVRPMDGGPPSPLGAQNLLLRPGFTLGDTSLVLYFDAADPGISAWSSWFATVYDPDTGSAQESKPMSPCWCTPRTAT
jgi:hypothetical protein